MNRRRYRTIGLVSTLAGGILGVWFILLDIGNKTYLLTLGPAQNQIYVNSAVPIYTALVFVFGVLFSFGLSMILNLHPPDKK